MTKAVPHGDALFTELDDGQSVLLDLQTHAYYGLNRTGTRIWQLMSEGSTLAEISARLADEFEASPQELENAVREFVRELAEANLVELRD
jgi:hypothetical protein